MDNINQKNDEIDIKLLLSKIWDEKISILVITFLFSIAALIYALTLKDIYKSNVVIAPVNDESSVTSSLRNYSSIANLAGISLPASSAQNKSVEAIEIIDSLGFFTSNILPKISLPDLMAVEKWNKDSNELIYNNQIYDTKLKKWIIENKTSESKPTAQQAYKKFQQNLLITHDIAKGFYRISIKHQSPYIAKEWLELIIKEINLDLRDKGKKEALLAIEFLTTQMSSANLSEIKNLLSNLIQNEIRKLTLIEANDEYVFKTLDPAHVPEIKSEPNRSFILFFGTIIGMLVGMFFVLSKAFFLNKEKL